jgi:hypothetical protein
MALNTTRKSSFVSYVSPGCTSPGLVGEDHGVDPVGEILASGGCSYSQSLRLKTT